MSAPVLLGFLALAIDAGSWERQHVMLQGAADQAALAAGLAVVTGGMEEDLAKRAGAPESVLELHESLGQVTLVIFVALLGLRLAMQRGWLKEIPVLTLGLGVIGIVILALAGYWGGDLVYTYGIGVRTVMTPVIP